MSNLRFLLRQLEPLVYHTLLSPGQDTCLKRVELLCAQTVLRADSLYLWDVSAAAELTHAQIPPPRPHFTSQAAHWSLAPARWPSYIAQWPPLQRR